MFFGQKTGKNPLLARYHTIDCAGLQSFFVYIFYFPLFFRKITIFSAKICAFGKNRAFFENICAVFGFFARNVTPALRFSLPKTAKQAALAPLSGEQKHTKGTARASARAALFYKEVGRGNRHGREIGGGEACARSAQLSSEPEPILQQMRGAVNAQQVNFRTFHPHFILRAKRSHLSSQPSQTLHFFAIFPCFLVPAHGLIFSPRFRFFRPAA